MVRSPEHNSRRKFLLGFVGIGVVATGTFSFYRCTGYSPLPGWQGKVLSIHQAHIIIAAGQAVLPPLNGLTEYMKVAENLDNYLATLPSSIHTDIKLMLSVVEHATFFDFQWQRFTRLNTRQRRDYLEHFSEMGGMLRLAYRGLRDFCMLGYYQQDISWEKIGYSGPLVSRKKRKPIAKYARLVAAPGELPQTMIKT